MCEAGSERSPDTTALKQLQPEPEGRAIHRVWRVAVGGVKWSYNLSLTSPSAQAGSPVGCCHKRFPLPASLLAHRWIRNGLGEEGKQKSHLYFENTSWYVLGVHTIWKPWLNYSLMWKEPFAAPVTAVTLASPVPVTCSLPPSSSLFCITHVTAAAFAPNVSSR